MYLKNIKDAHGDHPPNISNFLHYLNFIGTNQNIEFKQKFTFEPANPLVTTKLANPQKLSRVPRPRIVEEGLDETEPETSKKPKCKSKRFSEPEE